MPTRNDWECHDCSLVFEAVRNIDNPIPPCPYCQSKNVSWRPPLIAVQFKGRGFYETDYKRKEKDDE